MSDPLPDAQPYAASSVTAGIPDETGFRLFFERNPIPMLVHDQDSLRLLEANQAALDLYGYTRSDFLTLTLHDLWPGQDIGQALYGGEPPVTPKAADTESLRQRHCRADGTLIDVEVSGSQFERAGRRVRLLSLRDITRQIRAGREILRVSGVQRLLSACNEALVRVESRTDMFRQVCALAVQVGGYRLAWVGLASPGQDRWLEPVASAGDTRYLEDAVFSWGEGMAGHSVLVHGVMTAGEIGVADDLARQTDIAWPERARRFGLASAICLPLCEDDRVIGMLGLYSADPVQAGEDERRLLQTLMDDLAFGMGRMRALEEQRHIQSAMLQVAAAVSSHSGSAFFEQMVRHMLEVLGAKAGCLARCLPQGGLRTVTAIVEGQACPDFEWQPERTACDSGACRVRWMMAGHDLPAGTMLGRCHAQACVAYRVEDASGAAMGVLYAMLDHQPKQHDFIVSILQIFAASAASEMQRQEALREIRQIALHDALTGLPNRKHLMDMLEQALNRARHEQGAGALLFIDLDNFKTINDTLGHDKGDQLLAQAARRLRQCVRSGDMVGRLGGDEFVVLLEGLGTVPAQLNRQARRVARNILSALSAPYHIDGYTYENSSSIGVAAFLGGGETVGELMKQADMAMYQAKAAGRNGVCFFDRRMQADMMARALLEMDLRQALAQEDFALYYQPQSDSLGQVTGVEALVRWRHARMGLVSPLQFIPVAEETGLIVQLGQWILQRACERLAAWAGSPETARLTMSVNISAREFRHPRFVEQVQETLLRTGADPSRLKLELTESLMVEDIKGTIAKMESLRQLGIGFALDDFGTGYSSLSYLKRLPLEQIKIDRSFILDATLSRTGGAIVHSIFQLGRDLGLTVVAEGVENEAHLDFVLKHGCECYQGYFFSAPLPDSALPAFLAMHGVRQVRAVRQGNCSPPAPAGGGYPMTPAARRPARRTRRRGP